MISTSTQRLFEDDAYLTEVEAKVVSTTDRGLVLDRTIFFAESGGQAGDTGAIVLDDGRVIEIADTVYNPGRLTIVHVPTGGAPPDAGQSVLLRIDWLRRYRLMQMHSCLHIVSSLIEAPVTGCAIYPDHGRIDFDLPDRVLDKAELTSRISAVIAADKHISAEHWATRDVRAQLSLVRTATVAPPVRGDHMRMVVIAGLDAQPCGGTHVRSTREISAVNVRKIEKKSRHNRRVNIAFVTPCPREGLCQTRTKTDQ